MGTELALNDQVMADKRALDALMEETGGEITPANEAAVTALMASIGNNMAERVDRNVRMMKYELARAAAQKAEAEILYGETLKEAQAAENRVKWMKERLKWLMEQWGVTEILGATHSAKVTPNGGIQPLKIWNGREWAEPKSVPVPADAPAWAIREEWNTDELRKRLESEAAQPAPPEGEPTVSKIPFAALMPRGTHLRIK